MSEWHAPENRPPASAVAGGPPRPAVFGEMIMEFKDIEKTKQTALAPYFSANCLHMGDFSLAFQFMWHDVLKPTYAIAENCLILREYYARKHYFHYPLSLTGDREEERAAIAAIERYCRENYLRLHFTNVPKSRLADMVCRYGACQVSNNRRWRDYLYAAEDFREYPGKKYAGQRNHVRKFEKLYPDWSFSEVTPSDMGAVVSFLKEYESVQLEKHDRLASEEMGEVFALLPFLERFRLLAGALRVGSKIVGFSVGERCGDTVVVHIEKALRGYEGCYPFLAQQFAKKFCETARYLNRMDDAGDLGLRKSKLQYGPCEIVDKFNLTPKRAIDLVSALPTIETERLTLSPVRDEDAEAYGRLAADRERNRYFGEAWGIPADEKERPAAYYLKRSRDSFHCKMEMPLGIYAGGMFVGEVLLHTFGYTAEAEIGVRLLPEAEGRGYASEAVRAYTDHAFSKMNLERVEARCFCENPRSRAALLRAGMRETSADDTYFYFVRTPEM